MPILAIHHVNFHVAQPLLEDMKNFYCDVMGLTPGFRPEFKEFGYWLYADSIPVVHLYEAVGNDVRQAGVNSVFDHVAFHCNDLLEIMTRLEKPKNTLQNGAIAAFWAISDRCDRPGRAQG
jgi:catechol 2,3-dioxygenase-like lactoylglutathione lyase family enzyme